MSTKYVLVCDICKKEIDCDGHTNVQTKSITIIVRSSISIRDTDTGSIHSGNLSYSKDVCISCANSVLSPFHMALYLPETLPIDPTNDL